jgi:hypothetical protein
MTEKARGFPDFGFIDRITEALPPQIKDAVKDVTEKILDPSDTSLNIGDPQPEGEKPIPVDEGTEEMSGLQKALSTAVGLLGTLERLDFLIPDKYEDLLRKLKGALETVLGWLD